MGGRQMTKNLRDSRADRAHVRILMEQGYSDSRIAKETGISYAHVRQLTQQIRAEAIDAHLTQPAQAVDAWMTEDGRVISARQKAKAIKDGGASASSVAPYSFQLTRALAPAQAVDVGAIREVAEWLNVHACVEVPGMETQADKLTRALAGEKAEGWRVPDGWREAFEDCYMRANEVGILHRDDGEYTSVLTKVAWALWNERARLSPIDWWHASHDSEARAWTIHSPSGDSCEVHERAAGPHAEILRQLAQSLPTPPTDGEE